jgi:hypothetical protein
MARDDLAEEQKRVLLAQMAQSGSAASAAYQQGQADLQAQKVQALQQAVGASSGVGGVNDVGGLLTRRIASMEQGKQSRLGDIAQRTATYSNDLGLAQQGNTARRSEIDRDTATKRSELEREIAARRSDMESRLAIIRLEKEYEDRQRREEADARANDPVALAGKLRALRYIEDPDGTSVAARRQKADDGVLARSANINAEGRDASALLGAVRRHRDYGVAVSDAQRAASEGRDPEFLREALRRRGVNAVARDLVVAEYVAAQQRNIGRAAPLAAYEVEE